MTLYNLAESLILEVAARTPVMDCMQGKRIADYLTMMEKIRVEKVKDGLRYTLMVSLKQETMS